ncbi:hypothetical protein [Litoreibacter roseus]|uniref:DUF4136 domain-containing protein n=1 Tax=Litoreibacter roseus TaxID=2601869 RepID=A0A6N6JKQ1_9RHOB|nr:hypothetical protein [Litoreibacter roseus]GFE66430.1 hypothetical protein KIN_35040 [Litoreibacter roseus]
MGYIKTFLALTLSCFVLTACGVKDPDATRDLNLGDFRLGHNIVVTKNARKIGPTREATAEEWETLLEGEIEKQFGGYEGDKLYHLGINLDGYALAVPGVPVLLSPKSVLVISLTVWDDAAAKKLNEPPRQLTIFEQLDGGTVFGSGITRDREEQMNNLATQMSAAIGRFLVANSEWFGVTPTEEDRAAAEEDVLKIPDNLPDGATDADVPAT